MIEETKVWAMPVYGAQGTGRLSRCPTGLGLARGKLDRFVSVTGVWRQASNLIYWADDILLTARCHRKGEDI